MAVQESEASKPAPNYASLAANLANNNRKTVAPEPSKHDKLISHLHVPGRSKSTNTPPARQLGSTLGVASSKAAISAHSRRPRSQDGPNSAKPPPKKQTLQSRAAEAALRPESNGVAHDGSANPKKDVLGDRAAAAALKSWNKTPAAAPTTNRSIYGERGETASPAVAKAWHASSSTSTATPPTNRAVYGERGEKASPAVSAAWGAQKTASHRPIVTPLSAKEQAMIQAKINARKQESDERRERQPVIKIGAEFLGEHPPVRLEREEKAHAADLHEQAVVLAKQAFAKQQSNAANPSSVGSQAQQLANEKLAKLNKTDNELENMRNYYGTPGPPQRSKSQLLHRRSKSTTSRADADDVAQSQKIRSQMNTLRSQIDQVDAGKQEQDRKRLLEAARKKVQGDMLRLDEHVYKDTGKMSKAMMDEWEAKARERQRESRSQTSFQHMEHDKAVNIGGGKIVDQTDIDQLAVSRVKPTLAGIDEAVQKKRDLDQQKLEEKEERRLEKEKEKEEKAEVKREKAEEKRKVKEAKAAEKAAEQPEGDDKKSPLRLPAFTKFARHRRTESTENVSDDDASSIEGKEDKRRLSIFGKFGRGRHNDTEEQPAIVPSTEERELADSSSTRPRSKSLKSRFTKLVHRHQYSDAVEHQSQEPSFEPPSRPRSVSTDLEDDSPIMSPVDELDDPIIEESDAGWKPTKIGESSGITTKPVEESSAIKTDKGKNRESGVSTFEEEWHNADSVQKSSISAPAAAAGTSVSDDGRTSVDDRDDKLFGKHLPSKFHENM